MTIRGSAILTSVMAGLLGACGQGGLPGATAPDGAGTAVADAGMPGAPASGGLPCDVERVLVTRCQSCHQRPPLYGAPMPLVTFADAMATAPAAGTQVWRAMRAKVAAGLMPPGGSPGGPLTAAETATLMSWLDAGAPADPRSAACGATMGPGTPAAPADGPDALPCTPKYQFRAEGPVAGQPFAVPPGTETYRCFSSQVPFAAGEQAVAWAPIIDDRRVVHHYILYAHKSAGAPAPDCADQGRVFLLGWAPGGGNGVMPADVGLELPDPGTWLTLEVHYNNRAGYPDARDRSGVALCTTDSPRPQEAGVVTLGALGIAIPPGADDYVVGSEIPGVLTSVLPQPLHVLWTSPHMHMSGKSLRTELVRGGVTMPLVDVPVWDFGNQRAYPRDPATTLILPGDDVRTTCTYRNPTTSIIRFGERTENEMCFNFLVVYPIAGVPLREWVTR
jgi:hypothetical protein